MLPTLHSQYASTCFLVEHPSEIDVRAVACSLFKETYAFPNRFGLSICDKNGECNAPFSPI